MTINAQYIETKLAELGITKKALAAKCGICAQNVSTIIRRRIYRLLLRPRLEAQRGADHEGLAGCRQDLGASEQGRAEGRDRG